MTAFQLLTFTLLAMFAGLTQAAIRKQRVSRKSGVLWMGLWVLAALAVAAPNTTSTFAARLGIGRGADLVLYLGVLWALGGFFLLHARLRRLEIQLTTLVRRLALRDSMDGEGGHPGLVADAGESKSAAPRPDAEFDR